MEIKVRSENLTDFSQIKSGQLLSRFCMIINLVKLFFRFEENHRKDLPEEGECTEDEYHVTT